MDRRGSCKIDGENGDERVPRYTISLIIPNVDIIYLTVPLPLKLRACPKGSWEKLLNPVKKILGGSESSLNEFHVSVILK